MGKGNLEEKGRKEWKKRDRVRRRKERRREEVELDYQSFERVIIVLN